MSEIKYKTKTSKELLCWVLMFTVIYATDTVPIFFANNTKNILLTIGTVLLGIILLINNRWILRTDQNTLVFLVIPIAFILLSQIINADKSLGYENKIVILVFSYFIVYYINFESFRDKFIIIMSIIAIASLGAWIVAIYNVGFFEKCIISFNKDYYSIILSAIPRSEGNRYRNFGPFWEPGVFQAYLNIAIMFLLNKEHSKFPKYRLLLLVLAVISTLSTTGYICLAIVFAQYFLSNRTLNGTKIFLLLFALAVGIAVIIIGGDYVLNIVFGKFSLGRRSSYLTRIYDMKLYFEQWLKDPLFGVGITKSYEAVSSIHLTSNLYSSFGGTTSTSMREIASMGLYLGVVRLVLQWKFSRKISKSKISQALVFILFLILLNTEDYIYSLFFTVILYYGLEIHNDKNCGYNIAV